MDREAALKIIRECFSPVEIVRIVVEYDPDFDGDIAKVVVRDEQLSEALRGNGELARRAAMQSGLDLEVVTESELSDSADPDNGIPC